MTRYLAQSGQLVSVAPGQAHGAGNFGAAGSLSFLIRRPAVLLHDAGVPFWYLPLLAMPCTADRQFPFAVKGLVAGTAMISPCGVLARDST